MSSTPQDKQPACARCSKQNLKEGTSCKTAPNKRQQQAPPWCPEHHYEDIIQQSFQEYRADSEEARIARAAAQVEGYSYRQDRDLDMVVPKWTRLEDTIAFARLMGYEKIGIATCIGLLEETRLLAEVLSNQGFEPVSLCCKAGSLDKEALGLTDAEKVRPGGFEAACNPIAQARILNAAATDFNLLVGLCVGHDALFCHHSEAPVSTLVAKDRATGHNPVAALYGSYYFKRVHKHLTIDPGNRE